MLLPHLILHCISFAEILSKLQSSNASCSQGADCDRHQDLTDVPLLQVQQGEWYDSKDSNGYERHSAVTQFHDIIGFFMGKWAGLAAELLTAISILGTAIAQIVASAGSQYAIDPRYDKRSASFECFA